MGAGSPRLAPRELALAAALAVVSALVMHWPLPLELGSVVERDIGDPLVQAWQVAWGGHALQHQPLHYFQANQFYPLHDSLAFSDALTGYAPAGLVGEGVTAAIARYNLLFLFSYALAFLGAYLLARELGVRPAAACVAGIAYAYAPWRLEQDGHLHVLASGGIPLSLFLFVRGYRNSRPWLVFLGWVAATWQFSIGFTLGLQLGYLIGLLGVLAVAWWWRKGRRAPLVPRPVAIASIAGVVLMALTAVSLARPYQRVLDNHPEAQRTSEQLSGLSGPAWQFVAAPGENLVWGEATSGVRDKLSSVPEQTLFPGLVILVLAIVGLAAPGFPRGLKVGLGAGVLGCAVLSLGFHQNGPGALYPYRVLYELLPGWQGIRVPGRINTLTSLGLAMLAAGGAHYLLARTRTRAVAWLLAGLLVVAVAVEGSGFQVRPSGGGLLAGPSHPQVPKAPAGNPGVPAPQLHLPITIPANRRYVLWSADGFPELVNGRASFDPTSFEQLTAEVEQFPDRQSVEALRAIGVRSVVFHPNLALGTPWADLDARPYEDLGIEKTRRGAVIVFSLPPPED